MPSPQMVETVLRGGEGGQVLAGRARTEQVVGLEAVAAPVGEAGAVVGAVFRVAELVALELGRGGEGVVAVAA